MEGHIIKKQDEVVNKEIINDFPDSIRLELKNICNLNLHVIVALETLIALFSCIMFNIQSKTNPFR